MASQRKPSLGQEIDKLDKLRADRQAVQKKLDAAKKSENEQKQKVIELLKGQRLDQGSGQAITASIQKKEVTQAEDWQKIENYAKRNNCLHIFQRRLSELAIRELMQQRNGKPIPGTKTVEIEDLSVTTRKK